MILGRIAVVALIVGALVTGGAYVVVQRLVPETNDSVNADLPPPGDRVRAAIEGLRDSPVYVAPEAREQLTPAQQSRVAEAAAASDPMVFVVAWDRTRFGGYYLESEALQQIAQGVGEPGVYVLKSEGTLADAVDYEVTVDGYASTDLTGEPAKALLRYITEVDGLGTTERRADDYWGGTGGGLAAGALFAGLGYPVLIGLVGVVRLAFGKPFRLPGRWKDIVG